MFACRNLNLSYKGNKILKDIHFHIPEGTVFCITGESGSGKSSLLKVINGIIPEITEAEISGEIKLNDMRLNEMDIAQRSRYISTVYQNPKTQFYCVESTDELAFPLENRNLPKDEMVKIIKKYTELLDTEKLYRRFWVEAARQMGYPMKDRHALMIRSMAAEKAERLPR
mgnify:CR=1 FL=1